MGSPKEIVDGNLERHSEEERKRNKTCDDANDEMNSIIHTLQQLNCMTWGNFSSLPIRKVLSWFLLALNPNTFYILNLGICLRLDNVVDGFDDLTEVAGDVFKFPHHTNPFSSLDSQRKPDGWLRPQWGENVFDTHLQQQLESITCIQPCIRSIIDDANGAVPRQTRTQ